MKMEGDSDEDCGEDGKDGFSWPSQLVDYGREEITRLQVTQNIAEGVQGWRITTNDSDTIGI